MRNNKKSLGNIIILLLLIIAIVFGVLFFFQKLFLNIGSKYDDNNVGELYYSPIDPEHIYVDDNGIMFADNEILIVAKDGVSKSKIEKLAKKYNAEIVGHIEQTGDYQWIISDGKPQDIIEKLNTNNIVLSATLNYISNIQTESIDYTINSGKEWIADPIRDSMSFPDSRRRRAWGVQAINASYTWTVMNLLRENINPIRVGLIDNEFDQQHEDLGFAQIFYENYENRVDVNERTHGTHVAGTMAAKGNNDIGICGVYPYGDGRLYGASFKGANQYTRNTTSCMKEKCMLSELILRNVKVINCSYGYSDLAAWYNNSADQKEVYLAANVLGDFLNRIYNKGYEYIIVVASGNDSNDIVVKLSYNNITKKINKTNGTVQYDVNGIPKVVHKNNKGELVYSEEDNGQTTEYTVNGITNMSEQTFVANEDLESRHLDSLFSSAYSAIKEEDFSNVYNRILVVGAVGQENNYDICDFSNAGTRTDIYAPGSSIFSTIPGNRYSNKNWQGTSMASPHVAGVAANVWSVNNQLSGAEVKSIICDYYSSVSHKDSNGNVDYKMVDAFRTVEEAYNRLKQSGNVKKEPQNGAALGWIMETDRETAIKGVKVTPTINGVEMTDCVVTTDEYGHFECILPGGDYTLTFSKEGYNSKSLPVRIENGQVNYFNEGDNTSEVIVLNKQSGNSENNTIQGKEPDKSSSVNEISEAQKYARIVIDNERLWYDPWSSDGNEYAPINSTYAWFQDLNIDGRLEFIVGTQTILGQSRGYGFDVFEFTDEGKMQKITDGNTMIYNRSIILSPHFDGVRVGMPGYVYNSNEKYNYIFDSVNNSLSTTGFRLNELTIKEGKIFTDRLYEYLYAEPGETIEYYNYKNEDLSRNEMISKLDDQINNTTFYRAEIGTVPFSDKEAWITNPNSETLSDAAAAVVSACYDALSDKDKLQAFMDSYNTYSLVECDWNGFVIMRNELSSLKTDRRSDDIHVSRSDPDADTVFNMPSRKT